MTIYQPRRENVSTWTISVPDIKDWAEEFLIPHAALAYKGEGEYCPGEWCHFCKAAVKCRARAEAKLQLAAYEFALPPLLSDDEIEEILSKLNDISKWADEILSYAADSAINHGKQWVGYKIVEGRSVRKYTDESAVANAAKAAGYTDIYKQSLITLTEMEALLGKKKFIEILGVLITKPPGKLTLVPDTDKRPPVTISNVHDDFKEDI
jgi:ribosomal protein L17